MSKIISLFNLQKNSGKTTSAIFLSECLATLGFKVLLIDGNFQNQVQKKVANIISKSKLIEIGNIKYNKINFFARSWHFLPYCHYEQLTNDEYKTFLINFEYIIIDTPSLQPEKALFYLKMSDSVIIPIEDEFFGDDELISSLKLVYLTQNTNQRFYISGFLFNRTVNGNVFAERMKEKINTEFKSSVFRTQIYRNFYLGQSVFSKVDEKQKSISSLGFTDYLSFANEFLEKENKLI